MLFTLVFLIIIIVAAKMSMVTVKQSELVIIERLGRFHSILEPGLNFVVPFIDNVRAVVRTDQQNIKVSVNDVISSDNQSLKIDVVLFYTIIDPEKSVYEIKDLKEGINYLTSTTIRDVVSRYMGNEVMAYRGQVALQAKKVLDEALLAWGCRLDNANIDNISK